MPVGRLVGHNVVAAFGRTSMRLEPELWDALAEICKREGTRMSAVVRTAEQDRPDGDRTSAVRLYIFDSYSVATEASHAACGHRCLPRMTSCEADG